MTFGEMNAYTKRFNAILGGYPKFKDQRLANLMTDLEQAYGIPAMKNDLFEAAHPQLMQLYNTVSEERDILSEVI